MGPKSYMKLSSCRFIKTKKKPNSLKILNFPIIYLTIRGRVQTTWTNEGEGVAQMTTTLNNSYLVKVSTQGHRDIGLMKILSKWFVHAPLYKA